MSRLECPSSHHDHVATLDRVAGELVTLKQALHQANTLLVNTTCCCADERPCLQSLLRS